MKAPAITKTSLIVITTTVVGILVLTSSCKEAVDPNNTSVIASDKDSAPDNSAAYVAAQEYVRTSYETPLQAEFPATFGDGSAGAIPTGSNTWKAFGVVSAPNAAGMMQRKTWIINLTYESNQWTYSEFQLGGKVQGK